MIESTPIEGLSKKVDPLDLTPCFAAMCKCGGWVGVAVDIPQCARENSRSVAKWMRDGFKIEKVTVQSIRDGSCAMCECSRGKQKKLF